MFETISMAEFEDLYHNNEEIALIDVREKDEFKDRHIPGAQSVPLSEFPTEFEKDRKYYVVCASGGRSSMACQYLANNGYDVVNVMGGMFAWRGEPE